MKRTFSVFDLSFLRKGAVGEFLEKGAADATGVPLSIKTFQATKVFIIMEPESEEEEFEEEMATDNAHVDKGDEGEAVVPTGKESVKEWSETELYETESSDSENGEEDDDGSNGTGPPNNKGMIIRWNRLSRLQRSLVYAVLIIIVTLLVLLFSSGFGTDDNKDDSSKIIQDPIKNVSLVNEPAAIVVQPVKTAVKNVINERPAFTDMSVDTDSDGKYDDIQHTFPPSSSKNWNAKMDISIFITDQQQAISHRKIIRRWNRLSRLQRSLVYAVLIIIVTLLVLLFSSGFGTDDNKDDSSKIIQDPIKNVSLVNEPAAIVVQPVKTAVKNVINERPAFTDMSVDTDSDGKYDDIQHTFPPSSSKNWNAKMDISIFITDQQQAISHRKIIRRWNRLSRLQRSLVYAVLIIIVTLLVLLFSSGFGTDDNKDDSSKIIQDPIKNVSLVNEPAAIVVQPVKTAVENVINERPAFTGPGNARQYAVVQSFKHAWKGYKEHAWGHDNLKPVSGMAFDWFSLGLTIVDGLDTAYIMGLNEEFEEGRQWIKEHLVFTKNKDVNFFEVTIRVLGALLTNYHFTQDDMFLNKAKDLGERLMAAFSSPSGVPYSDVNLSARTAHAPEWSHYSTTAEVTTVQLEFRELSRAADNPAFEDAAGAVSEKIHQLPKKHGLVPIFINPNTGHFLPHATITLGARGDSYYEYLLKQWLQTGKTVNFFLDDYMTAIEGVREYLAKRSSPNKRLFIGELSAGSESFNPKMDHLTCFLPGTLALGHANGLPDWHMTMAEELLHTCYLTYAAHPSFLAPEITHFNMASTTDDMYTKTADAHSLLRPEFVESLWYMYQITGNTTFQDWGWHIYQSIEKHAKVPNGYTSLANVKSEKPLQRDMMETFFLSETLKYLYLLFSDDRYVIDLSKYVMNSEAHPLPIHKN